jgi:glycosyltransferase involved in cell wall biosynthesis
MRIAVDAKVLTLPDIRGIGTYVLEILKHWPTKNDEFYLFFESGTLTSRIETLAQIIPERVPEPPGTRFKVWNWLAMPKALKRKDVDIVWCPGNIPIPFCNIPQILTIHDTLLQESFRKHSFIDNIFYRYLVPYWTKTYVDHIITVSNFSKNRISEIFKINLNIIEVIYNGLPIVEMNYLAKSDAIQFLEKMNIVKGPFIYALGAESSWKNTELLLNSFACVHQSYSNLSLIITGIQDIAMEKFKLQVSNLGLNSVVKLFGFVDTATRNALYQAAQIFIYPSLFEGFGFPPLEAMTFGCPVICSDRASMPEIVGGAAKLVDCTSNILLAEAIIKTINNKKIKQQLIQNGYSNIKRFNWNSTAIAHRYLFEKAIS